MRSYFLSLTLGFLVSSAFCHAQVPLLTNQWSVNLYDLSDSTPAVAPDGTVYFGTSKGALWALGPDGSRKWIFHADRDIWSSPAVADDGVIYFGSRDRALYALSPDGKPKWSFKTGGWVDSSPAMMTDGTVCFGSWDKSFYALKPDGSVRWQFKTGGPIVSSAALGSDGKVYFGSHDRKFYALSPEGAKVWEFAAAAPILSSPALDHEGHVFFTSVDGWFLALQPDGQLWWRLKTGGITMSSPIIGSDGALYVGVNKQLWAVTATGKVKWQHEVTTDAYQQPVEASPLALSDQTICAISGYGYLHGFDADGHSKWGAFLHGHGYSSPVLGTDGLLLSVEGVENVGHAFAAFKADVTLASSPWPKFRGDSRNTGRLGR